MFKNLFVALPLLARAIAAAPWPNSSKPSACGNAEAKTVTVTMLPILFDGNGGPSTQKLTIPTGSDASDPTGSIDPIGSSDAAGGIDPTGTIVSTGTLIHTRTVTSTGVVGSTGTVVSTGAIVHTETTVSSGTIVPTASIDPAGSLGLTGGIDPTQMATNTGKVSSHGGPAATMLTQSEVKTRSTSPEVSAPVISSSVDVDAPKATFTGGASPINAVYYGNWDVYKRKFHPQDIPTDDITHVLYAFAKLAANGSVVSSDANVDVQSLYEGDVERSKNDVFGSVKQLYLVKKKNRNLKTLLSIGGWTASQGGGFDTVKTDSGRQLFASSAVRLLADWGFDGLDIDWEYPTDKSEAKDFLELLKACREALDRYAEDNGQDYHYLLTIASSAGPEKYKLMNLKGMDEYLDAWHLMAYDYAGSWDKTSGNMANIYPDTKNLESTKFNTEQAINDYLDAGIAPEKIVMGLALYGRAFETTNGLGKPFNGTGSGSFEAEKGVWQYYDLPRPGANVQTNKEIGSSWCYNNNTKELVSYDTAEVAKIKANYILDKGLGGAFFWEVSGDKKGDDSLVGAMSGALGDLEKSQNMLDYPASQYENMKNGMEDA